jgi:hypothetical protein
MSESNKVTKRFVRSSVAIILCASAMGQSQPEPSPSPSSMSPDKKWQYAGGDAPKIVQAGSNQVALELERCGPGGSPENSAVLWAPDSRRLAFYGCGGKQQLTLLYQLRDEGWVALETPGDGDELFERVGNIIEGQAKTKGLLKKKTFLHMQWWAVEPQRWLDGRTLTMHVSMGEVLHGDNGDHVGPGFRADLLVTLEFNDAGDWKIVKTHRMSEKESKKFEY